MQTPILIDGTFEGQPRKLLAQANRNGYFFLLDRTNGKNLLTAPMIRTMNWSKGTTAGGQPVPDPRKEATIEGVLVSPPSDGATNWPPPSFDPETGLFYVGVAQNFSMFYLTDTDPHPEGYGAAERYVGSYGGERGPLAQRLEQRTHNPLVVGSNPTGPTNQYQYGWSSWRLLKAADKADEISEGRVSNTSDSHRHDHCASCDSGGLHLYFVNSRLSEEYPQAKNDS